MGKLITVSFRLPYRLSTPRNGLVLTPSVGGLATAMRAYFDKNIASDFESLHWIGVGDIRKKTLEDFSASMTIEKDNLVMHPVFLSSRMKERFYDGFCNSVLWPLFLYFPSFVSYKKEFFEEYLIVNEILRQKVLEVYQPGDTIWIHDYHWMVLPGLIRESLPEARIGFFLHIPFPDFELFRMLPKPWRAKLLTSLLGSDVIGLQTADFTKHFIESISRILPDIPLSNDGIITLGARSIVVRHFSISIDYGKFHDTSRQEDVVFNAKKIREGLNVSKIILSVDRLDYTKAIFNRLEGFELFLKQNTQFNEKVSYVLMMVPTRESILKYKENKHNVEALITRINGTYGTLGWTPIVYQYQTVEFKRLVSLYAASDVALIVPSRDGMNLVAKEYIASRVSQDGVLILSETAGSAAELQEAILVNSNDRQEIADSILIAMTMSLREQKRRVEKMQAHVQKNDVAQWAETFLSTVLQVPKQEEVEL